MAGERYTHIFLAGPAHTQDFTNPKRGGLDPRIPSRDRALHSAHLHARLQEAWAQFDRQSAVVHVERHGAYIEFESEPGFELAVMSLEYVRSGIRLLNVRKEGEEASARTFATVYVPHNKRNYFFKRIQAYAHELRSHTNKPKHAKMVDSISDIRLAVLKSFWRSDEYSLIPSEEPGWVEVWLRSDKDEVIARFEEVLRTYNIEIAEGALKFPERSVKLIRANRRQLEQLITSSEDIAEFRAAKEIASFYIVMQNADQLDRVRQLLSRADFKENPDVAICLLDTGVNNGHMLLKPILKDHDLHAVDPGWGGYDHEGHGTLMAGTAAYGDLLEILNSGDRVQMRHCLESVKILPPPPAVNPKKLWGYMTSQGVNRAEIQAPQRKRIACLAVTSTEGRDRGRPSSWSAMVDELTSGYADNFYRLFIISAGNVTDSANWRNYPIDNITNQVHDPGQSWNALTVGAFTEKTRTNDPTLVDYLPIAPAGGLSPYSTTSTAWHARTWPIKPEVMFEGGNVARGPNDSIQVPDDLQLLSTYHDPQVAQFAPFMATSAASAQGAWMAAQIQEKYPNAWPETIRALIVHTAEWTDKMQEQFLTNPSPTKQDYANLLRICGYGVPKLERALYCASNALTLISETELQPFDKNGDRYVTRDMHLYNLPWPSDALSELGATQVKMRVTLSYFIEPGPGEIGWSDRYRYPSHALRFAVNGPGETEDDFVRRVNKQAREDGEPPGTEGPGNKWLIGDARNVGSIHSDIWEGTGADLSTSHFIAVYPAVGWWRERRHLNRWGKRCRYSLIVSINTPDQNIDIYTPVAIKVGVVTPIAIEARRP